MIEERIALFVVVSGRRELKGLQAGGCDGHGAAEFTKFDGDVGDQDIDDVEAAALPLRASVARAIGDAAHFLEAFAIEAAEEGRAGLRAQATPSGGVEWPRLP